MHQLTLLVCSVFVLLVGCLVSGTEAWGRTSGGADAGIRFLADDSGSLSKALGLVMDTPIGIRTKRFSMIVSDGEVTNYFSSAKQSSDTWAPAVLSAL